MGIQNVSTFTDDSAEKQALDRQRQLALLLQNQSMQPLETNQMAGGYVVPISATQGIAKMLQAFTGAAMNHRLDEQHKELATQSNQKLAQVLQNYQQTSQGTPAIEGQPEVPAQPERPYSPQMPQGMPLAPTPSDTPQQQPIMQPPQAGQPAIPGQPAVPGDRQAAMAQLLASGHPALQQMGMQQIANEPEVQARKDQLATALADKQTAREQQNNQFNMQLAQQKHTQEQADLTRRDLAKQSSDDRRFAAGQNASLQRQLQMQGGKPPPGYRFTPEGSLEAIPGGPADQKLTTAMGGKETVSNIVGGLRDSYDQLSQGGGITDPTKGTLSNMAAGASSSAAGQMFGKALGTNNQSVRNTVQMTRPLLLQAIMKATGMSSKQMDSNTELKLYLATATDPTLDVAANKRALDKIEELYGMGSKGAQQPATGGSASGGWSIKPL